MPHPLGVDFPKKKQDKMADPNDRYESENKNTKRQMTNRQKTKRGKKKRQGTRKQDKKRQIEKDT